MIVETAKAKINLSLKVLGRYKNGYHKLHSLVAFADMGDQLSFEPADAYKLSVGGPFSKDLVGSNLIDHMVEFIRANYEEIELGHFHLIKNLPIASGIGGGSADAAAALRILSRQLEGGIRALDIKKISLELGADVPVCLTQRASFMSGIGEDVQILENFPKTVCVLVNPGVQISTREIFRNLQANEIQDDEIPMVNGDVLSFHNFDELLEYITLNANDLQKVAAEICPDVPLVIEEIQKQDGCYLAQMSGSGATCFGLFKDLISADTARQRLKSSYPKWWINYGYLT